MVKNLLSICFLSLVGLLVFSSCGKEESEILTTENYVTSSIEAVHERCGAGKKGCFELVYPITITLPDGTIVTIEDLEDLKTTLRTYKENNPSATERPEINFPIDVITEEGELITVNSKIEMLQLKKECRMGQGSHGGNLRDCFKLVFPISISFPDGTIVQAASGMALKTALKTWKMNNQGSTERPELVFPMEINQDDVITTVNSREEMRAIREACKGE